MKKILLLSICAFFSISLLAQETPATPKKKEKIDLSNRSNDHFLIQLGYLDWAGIPDTINTAGL